MIRSIRALAVASLAVAAIALPPARAAAEDETGAIAFVVTGSDGKPIAGADVGVWNDDDRLDAVTDAGGKAHLRDVPVGEWTASAAAEKWTAEEQDVEVDAGAERTVTFTLSPGIPFSGRVVDASDAPVAGAYVKAIAGGTFEGYGEVKTRAPYARVYTADDGTFRVRGIPPGAVSTLVVSAEGFRDTEFSVRAQGDGVRPSPVQVVLDRGGTVTGRVFDADSHPVDGAVVYLVPADQPQLIRNPRVRTWSTDGKSAMAKVERTDSKGRFSVSGLGFGEALVAIAEAEGHARSLPSDPLTTTEKARVVEVDVRLRRATTITVRLSTPAGESVTDATVRTGEVYEGGIAVNEPDATGAFVLTGLPEGDVELTIDAKGFQRQAVRAKTTAEKVTDLAVKLDAGASLAGIARDEEGKPLAGVYVWLTLEQTAPNGGWSSRSAGKATTDAAGRFAIGGLEKAPHKLNATLDGKYALPDELTLDPPNTSLDLVLREMGTIRMRFVLPKGAPALPERVMVWRWDLDEGSGSGSKQPLEGDVLVLRGGRGVRERVRVSCDDYLPFERELRVDWGQDIDLGDVKLDPGVTLRGRVVGPEDKPVQGALVGWADLREAVTGEDGSFTLEHVPGESPEIIVEAEGFLPLKAKVATGSDGAPTKLTLYRGAVLTGRLVNEQGEPLGNHWIQFRRPPTSADDSKGVFIDETGTEDDGTFEIRIAPGPCRVLFIERDKTIHVLAELVAAEGKSEKLALTLK